MFKKGLDVLNKTKNAAQASMMEQEKESEQIEMAKASLKNMKWSIKLLIQLARGYYMASDKQVQQGTAFSQILQRFSEKISHTNYIINSTLPLSDSLREVGEGIKSSQIYFQQYSQQFSDRFALQIEGLYKNNVKKVSELCKQQEEVRLKYNSANNHLKSAQKSGHSGTKLAEKTTEFENAKAHYDQISANLVEANHEMTQYVQKEVALLMKAFVTEQQLLVDECIKMWINAEAKLFNSQSPTNQGYPSPTNQQEYNPSVNLSKLSLDEQIVSPPPPQQQQQQEYSSHSTHSSPTDFSSQHQQYQQEYQPPQQQQQQQQTSPNPFDDKNPFDN